MAKTLSCGKGLPPSQTTMFQTCQNSKHLQRTISMSLKWCNFSLIGYKTKSSFGLFSLLLDCISQDWVIKGKSFFCKPFPRQTLVFMCQHYKAFEALSCAGHVLLRLDPSYLTHHHPLVRGNSITRE